VHAERANVLYVFGEVRSVRRDDWVPFTPARLAVPGTVPPDRATPFLPSPRKKVGSAKPVAPRPGQVGTPKMPGSAVTVPDQWRAPQ